MATSTLKLTPKGHLAPTMFNRATVLRHTNTTVPQRDCIICSAPCTTASRPCFTLSATQQGLAIERKPPSSTDHQCLFCKKCLGKTKHNQDGSMVGKNKEARSMRSSQEILGVHIRDKNDDSNSDKRKAILNEALTARDCKPRHCGFCSRGSGGTQLVRYCTDCKKYLCSGCYLKHQGQGTGGNWMYRYHATIDLAKIRNPDIM